MRAVVEPLDYRHRKKKKSHINYFRATMQLVDFFLILMLISKVIARSINDCNDPNFHSLETLNSSRAECGPAFKNRCYCLRTCYDGHYQYVVNCSYARFQDVNPLAHLPNQTQVREPSIASARVSRDTSARRNVKSNRKM